MSDFMIRGIPSELLAKIDNHCRRVGISRQAYVRDLLIKHALTLPPNTKDQVAALSNQQAHGVLLDILSGHNAYEALQNELSIDR